MIDPYHKYSMFECLTSQITGGKKQSDEGAALFAVRVHLPCWTEPLRGEKSGGLPKILKCNRAPRKRIYSPINHEVT